MKNTTIRLEVMLEDYGDPLTVVVDQRDFAQWETFPGADDAGNLTRVRRLAYTALTRQGRTASTWDDFNQRECVNVDAAEESEGEQTSDPGRPTPGDGNTSRSPAVLAKRSPRS